MNIRLIKRAAEGSIILVSLLVAAIAGVTLASYLMLTESQNQSVYRSQSWNTALALTEAGIEDGLQFVNRYAGSMDEISKWTNHAVEDSWKSESVGVYYMKRTIPFADSVRPYSYEVWITNTDDRPKLYCRADLPWTYRNSPSATTATIGLNGSTGVTRDVRVMTKRDRLFTVAMAALEYIDLRGRNVRTDSFDSASEQYSNNGRYPYGMPDKTKDNGDVCTDLALIDSLNVGNARIRGKVRTGPGPNTISVQSGSVGDRTWVDIDKKSGILPGWSSTDFNVAFPEVEMPPDITFLPVLERNEEVSGIKYQYVIDSTTPNHGFQINSLTGSVLISAPTNSIVYILIKNDVSMSGDEVIRLADTGATLRIYLEKSFSTIGNAGIINESAMSDRLYVFGLPTCEYINFGGNTAFHGGVYAPNARFLLGGGGANTIDFIGSSVTRSVSLNGHFNFHYDENMARIGPSRGYIPVDWDEM